MRERAFRPRREGSLNPPQTDKNPLPLAMIQRFVEIRLRRTCGKVAELYRAGTRDPLEKKKKFSHQV
ncbi:hypothetical protein COLO4_37000 [Corchorus olitorius]|uniref:Uncharacterized protein n=1 Tax=Corchorus olitorius TaxID=93759 RepID=A0A1R3G3W2_9ROSI|nr:hypothetical protein COLO4_37000 [Corchorus olitorius]